MKRLFITLLLLLSFLAPAKALASNDLSIECDGNGSCIASPSLPIFDDSGLYPGQTITSQVVVKNTSSYSGDFAFQINNLSTGDINQVIDLLISSDVDGNSIIYGPMSLSSLNSSYIVLDNFSASEEKTFYFHAIFDINAGNDYQDVDSSFDMQLGFDFVKDAQATGQVAGLTTTSLSTTPAQAPSCNNENLFPSGPTNFRVLGQTDNTMTLAWDAVDQATGYAIFFTRADGEAYSVLPSMIPNGSTQFTINNLAASNYFVEIVAVGGNDDLCSSPRSSLNTTIVGPIVAGRPVTQEGDVLGKNVDENGVENITEEDKVLGASISCENSKSYLFLLLIVQFLLALIVYFVYRSKKVWSKQIIIAGLTILSIIIFYWLRDCSCLDDYNWLNFICQWYFLISIVESLLIQAINYSLIEE